MALYSGKNYENGDHFSKKNEVPVALNFSAYHSDACQLCFSNLADLGLSDKFLMSPGKASSH